DADFLALRVGQHEDLALLAQQEAREDLAVLESQVGDPERLVDVAVGVEDVLHEAVESAAADAVELGPDLRPLAAKLVADAAVLLVDRGPRFGLRRRGPEPGPTALRQRAQLLVGWRPAAASRSSTGVAASRSMSPTRVSFPTGSIATIAAKVPVRCRGAAVGR